MTPAQAKPPSKTLVHSVADVTLSVGENSVVSFAVNFTRSGQTSKCASTVAYQIAEVTTDGSASDFSADASGVLTFAKGGTGNGITVGMTNDGVPEDAETFTVTLSSPTTSCKGGVVPSIGSAVTTVTITDTDTNFVVPADYEIRISNIEIGGCNTLSAALEVPGDDVALGTNSAVECESPVTPDDVTWVNPGTSAVTVRLAVVDEDCGSTFYSDTAASGASTLNHASVVEQTTEGIWDVDIADAGFFGDGCQRNNEIAVPAVDDGNFSADVEIVPFT